MSTTIGLGYASSGSADIFHEVQALADKFGYGVLSGIACAESDVRDGLETARQNERWEHLIFLQSPKFSKAALAFGIDQELTAFETKGRRPKFFNFLVDLAELCSGRCAKLGIFFAGEWYKNDRVRFVHGSIDDLIYLLSMPGHWGVRYLIPETGELQDSDEIPLLFDLQL